MAGIIDNLVEVLTQQKECYEGLLTLATYKTQAVVEKNIEVLTEVVEREEAFIGRVQLLDQKRESLLKDIALVTGMPYKNLTITKIIDKMGEDKPVSQQLMVLRTQLKDLMEDLKKQNELNKQVLEQSMAFVEFTVNAIKTTQLTEAQVNYTRPGAVYEERTKSFFDQKQ